MEPIKLGSEQANHANVSEPIKEVKQRLGDPGSPLMVEDVLGDMIKHKTEIFISTIELTQFVATISGIILTLSLGEVLAKNFASLPTIVKLGIFTIIASSLMTIVFSLLIIEPRLKIDRDANTFDYGSKLSSISREQYIKTIENTLSSEKRIIDTYGHELHKLDMTILHRHKMLKSTIIIFLAGLGFGGVLIVLSTFM